MIRGLNDKYHPHHQLMSLLQIFWQLTFEEIHSQVQLHAKYDRPVPRYTSYPTVPYWQTTPPTQQEWLTSLNTRLEENRDISVYVHLPFCEQLCTYCACNKRITKNHDVEMPYIRAVLAEWRLYLESLPAKPRIKELHLGGGTPTFFSPTSLAQLVDGLLRNVEIAADHSFGLEAHPNGTTRAHLEVLAARGFNRASIGVQDFNPDILGIINRRQSEEQVIKTVESARAAGFDSINFDIIYGLPKQTENDIIRSVAKIDQLRPDRIAFYGYAHVPWVSPGQRAYSENDLPRGVDKWELYESGKQLLEEIGYKNIGLDHFALPGDDLYRAHRNGLLHRNFMGYTTANTPVTIALGCSAIGDSWDTYVQNEKKVEEYQRFVVNEKRLPIVRGHRLSSVDQTVRRHILNLMCQGKTNWQPHSLRCDSLNRAISQWNEMAADGILSRSPYQVRLTESGKPFLRNVCLPLDDHYWARQPKGNTFSQAI